MISKMYEYISNKIKQNNYKNSVHFIGLWIVFYSKLL